MNLRRNILANYASQIYVTAVGIVMVPLYIKYMGPEAYGLVGFYVMLQAWFNLLDMGLTPTMARESSRFSGGAISALEYRRLARALEGMFAIVALVGGALLFWLSGQIAEHWLNVKDIPKSDVESVLRLMAFMVALRWMSGMYRGVITGAEKLVWLSAMNGLVATGRFVVILPILMFVSTSPQTFFLFQLVVAVIEIVILVIKAYQLLPAIPNGQRIQWQFAPLKPVLKFAMSIAFTTSVWMLVTQTDKLVLSKILMLEDYGYFTVAVLLASSIMIVSGPISGALMPRMARLHAEGKSDQLIELYRQGTQMVTVMAIPVAAVFAAFAKQVLWSWSGNADLASKAATTLTLYSIGYGLLAVGAFPYYLQYAKGDLKLHLIGNALLVLLLIPSVIWAASHFGMVGAGWAWLVSNTVYFFVWPPLVHRRFAPNLHVKWLIKDIMQPALPVVLIAVLFSIWEPWSIQRGWLFVQMILAGLVFLITASGSSERIRFFIRSRLC